MTHSVTISNISAGPLDMMPTLPPNVFAFYHRVGGCLKIRVNVQPSDHFLPINRVKLHFQTFLGQLHSPLQNLMHRTSLNCTAVNVNAFYLTARATDVHCNVL